MFTTKCTQHIFQSKVCPLSTANQLVFQYNVKKCRTADLSAVVIILHTFPQISFMKFAKHARQFHDKTQKLMKKTQQHHLQRHKSREHRCFMFKNNQRKKKRKLFLNWKGHPNTGFQMQMKHKTCTLSFKNMI